MSKFDLFQQFSRVYNTISLLKPVQIYSRLVRVFKCPLYDTIYRLRRIDSSKIRSTVVAHRALPLEIERANGFFDSLYRGRFYRPGRAKRVLENRFSFINVSKVVEFPHDWKGIGQEKLWAYNLHYFDYVIDLALACRLTGDQCYYQKFRELVLSWICFNPVGVGVGWEPYPLSLRIVNWIKGISLLHTLIGRDEEFKVLLLNSLYMQCKYLRANLEYHLLTNHFLENLRALYWGGLFFTSKEAESWFQFSLHKLTSEISEQVLFNGSHIERSPMYHLIVLQDLLEIGQLAEMMKRQAPQELRNIIAKMSEFVAKCTHGDGGIALLNDSAFRVTLEPKELLSATAVHLDRTDLASWAQDFSCYAFWLFGEKGYDAFQKLKSSRSNQVIKLDTHFNKDLVRVEVSKECLLLDVDDIGPDYNPGHGHADSLGFEFSIGRSRWFVDSGTYTYRRGAERDYFRSTRAHNTVEVDGQNSSEVWASFRVAKRAHARIVGQVRKADLQIIHGMHDGYARLKDPVLHNRLLLCLGKSSPLWIIVDLMISKGYHKYSSFVHCHPEVRLLPGFELNHLEFTGQERSKKVYLCTFGFEGFRTHRAEKNPMQGWYSPEFNRKYPSTTLEFRAKQSGSSVFGYAFSTCGLGQIWDIEEETINSLYIRYEDRELLVSLKDKRLTISRDDHDYVHSIYKAELGGTK